MLATRFDIRGADLDAPVASLSGGNVQKVVLARELSADPRLLIAAQPTRGLDLGAAEPTRNLLIEQRDAGRAVFVISEDLDELVRIADRVAVIYEGRIMGTFPAGEADQEEIGLLMAGRAHEIRSTLAAVVRCPAPRGRGRPRAVGARPRADRRLTLRRALLAPAGAFGSKFALTQTALKAIPLALTGLAVAVCLRMRLWNIGAEGQFHVGAIGATWAALTFSTASALVLLPLMVVAAWLPAPSGP